MQGGWEKSVGSLLINCLFLLSFLCLKNLGWEARPLLWPSQNILTLMRLIKLFELSSIQIVETLLEHGAHIDARNSHGLRPLDMLKLNPDCKINPLQYLTLRCLAANVIVGNGLPYKPGQVPTVLEEFIEAHWSINTRCRRRWQAWRKLFKTGVGSIDPTRLSAGPLSPKGNNKIHTTTTYLLPLYCYYQRDHLIRKKNYERKICISLAKIMLQLPIPHWLNTASKNCYRIYDIPTLYRYNSIQNIEDRSEYLPTSMLCTFKKQLFYCYYVLHSLHLRISITVIKIFT